MQNVELLANACNMSCCLQSVKITDCCFHFFFSLREYNHFCSRYSLNITKFQQLYRISMFTILFIRIHSVHSVSRLLENQKNVLTLEILAYFATPFFLVLLQISNCSTLYFAKNVVACELENLALQNSSFKQFFDVSMYALFIDHISCVLFETFSSFLFFILIVVSKKYCDIYS